MKFPLQWVWSTTLKVAPLAGARIEIADNLFVTWKEIVAPLAGARIEIPLIMASPPEYPVAPLAGARIEMLKVFSLFGGVSGRSPRGSAD